MTRGERAAEVVLVAGGFGFLALTAIFPLTMAIWLSAGLIVSCVLGRMLARAG